VAIVFYRKAKKVKLKEMPAEAEMKLSRLAWRSILVFFLLASCQSKPVTSETLVGKWQDPSSTLELQDDGLFILTHEDNSKSYSGSWKLLEDGRVQMDFTARGAPQTAFLHVTSVSKDQLNVKGPDGKETSLQRIK
jgi:hypothetical protein